MTIKSKQKADWGLDQFELIIFCGAKYESKLLLLFFV